VLFSSFRNHESAQKAQKAIRYLEKLFSILDENFMIPLSKISFEAGLCYTKEFYSGLIIQLVASRDNKRYNVLSGGRYDKLIEKYEEIINPGVDDTKFEYKLSGVGLSIDVHKLVTLVKQEKIQDEMLPVFAYIVSPEDLFNERIQTSVKCWEKDIRTDYLRTKSATVEKQLQIAKTFQAKFVILLDSYETYYTSGTVKVYDIEEDKIVDRIHKNKIPSYLSQRMFVTTENINFKQSLEVPIRRNEVSTKKRKNLLN